MKKLDTTIEAILPVHRYLTATYSRFKAYKNKLVFPNSCNVRFATREEAESAAEKIKTKIGENGLRLVDVYSLPSKAANSVPQDK